MRFQNLQQVMVIITRHHHKSSNLDSLPSIYRQGEFWRVCLIVLFVWVITKVPSLPYCFKEILAHGLWKFGCDCCWICWPTVYVLTFHIWPISTNRPKCFHTSTPAISDHISIFADLHFSNFCLWQWFFTLFWKLQLDQHLPIGPQL